MFWIFELSIFWRRFQVITSSAARVMIDSVGDVEAVRQLDLRLLFEFLRMFYFELDLEILI